MMNGHVQRDPLSPRRARPASRDESYEERRTLHPLAVQIRAAYIFAYREYFQARHGVPSDFGSRPLPRWDGGRAGDGRVYQPIWYRIARTALEHRVSPDDLISIAFRGWDAKDPPWPTNLINEDVVRQAAENPGIKIEDTRRALQVQCDVWDLQIFLYRKTRDCDVATAARATLRNRRLELSSIFRYCMATRGDDPETAALFEDDAARQYIYHRDAYDAGWGDLIPDYLRRVADAFIEERAGYV